MININKDTGFYRGDIFTYESSLWRNECVPVALGNYLLLNKIPKETIDNMLVDLEENPIYNDSMGGFELVDVPIAIDEVLKKHIDPNIESTLYVFGAENIPPEYQHKVKSIKGSKNIATPTIVFTHSKPKYNHFWVATNEDPPKKIDNDGIIHDELETVFGYLEIKGLKNNDEPRR